MSKVQVDGPVVIAMKGHPCTGKTTLAEKLAKSLKYPIIAQDDVWDSIVKKELENPMLLTSINDLSFAVICQIASMELIFGSKLIIDSSLQCQAHVDRLIQMSKDTNARLVIVECKPRDRYEWQQRFKQRCESQGTCRFKPSTWEDLEREMEINGECSNVEGVSKLVVNTTEYVKNRNLADVVKHLVTLQDSLCIDFHEYCWGGNSVKQIPSNIQKEEDEAYEEVDTEEIHYHELILYHVEQNIDDGDDDDEEEEEENDGVDNDDKDDGDDNDVDDNDGDDGNYNDEQEEVICQGCLQPISDPVYYECEGCYIYAHKSCAELPNKKELMPSLYPPLLQDLPDQYSFPEIHRCRDCESNSIDDPDCDTNNGDDPDGDESNGSDDPDGETNSGDDESNGPCNQCLFETNLRCGVLPSIVLHDCHQHPLRIQLNPFRSNHEFDCKACGDYGEHASYSCSDCGTDTFECHLSCALLPRTYKHSCHRHPLKLISHIEQDDDDDDDSDELYCYVCEKTRNPNHWIYYCAKCKFTCHLKCMISKFEA
ncbi:Cytidylate kinase [Actinidia chinensis var. chinensis]|uniref:Cytidylate kinase n=1 Tax=Actinidia chinensis var. chinensis TaxID=1590841 RepID=A0A2R6S139_ACTCC|nr:Cytidylate kinase [Actinidia chinensis var. chinensis]